MYEKLESCPCCKSTQFTNHMICKDHSVSGESFALMKCVKCELIFTSPRPDSDTIAGYYKSDNYISHTNKSNNPINTVYRIARSIALRRKINLIQSYTSAQDYFDFGCGTGHFIKYAQSKGKVVSGMEPDADARKIAADITQSSIYESLDSIKPKFDVITAWHVLEHVGDLRGTLKMLKKRLNAEGFLFIAVPNINSFDAQHYKEYWAGIDVPRHFYHFTQTAFSHLAKAAKLRIVDIHPMTFDSYYVSLLSEKYQTGKSNYLKALKIGQLSNQKAANTGEYSSLIYVLQK